MRIKNFILHRRFALLFFALAFSSLTLAQGETDTSLSTVRIQVDSDVATQEFDHFWASTGYTPAKITLKPEMRQAIELYGGIPHDGMTYLRVHYLLDLVGCDDWEAVFGGRCDYAQLDSTVHHMVSNGFKPIFELMGNPSGLFTNFGDSLQLHAYKALVEHLATRYLERYSEEEVLEWYFETVNEPNWKGWWDHGYEQFLHYYDACSEGLKAAHPGIRFGGPGTYQTTSMRTMFKILLDHCARGVNYFTGEQDVRLDFISFHFKELPHLMIDREWSHIKYVRKNYPELSHLPFSNDEADPTAGWKRHLWWRSGPWYAAFIAQSAQLHLDLLMDSLEVNYSILSNDHGFLGGWHQRTMLTSFVNADSSGFYLIKKPAHSVFSLMSMLGHQKLSAKTGIVPEQFGHIATRRANGDLAILLYFKPEFDFDRHAEWWKAEQQTLLEEAAKIEPLLNAQTVEAVIQLQELKLDDAAIATYSIDAQSTHPYKVWQELGGPEAPSPEVFRTLQRAQEPHVEIVSKDLSKKDKLQVRLKGPGVHLIVISAKDHSAPPEQVSGLSASFYIGFNGEPQCLLKWPDIPQRNIRQYEVFRQNGDGDFRKISPGGLIDGAFADLPGRPGQLVRYKVRAVDYWGRAGAFSAILEVAVP